MKKILSIAAVSIISSALLASNANASSGCRHSFDSYVERMNCSGSCKITEPKSNVKSSEYDSMITELLKDCDVIYYDSCPGIPEKPQNPDTVPDIQKPETDIQKPTPENPVLPEQKPETDNNSGNQENTDSAFVREILDLVNKERKSNGLSPVEAGNTKLNSAAGKRASEQAIIFSHTRPDGSNWTTVLGEYGIKYGTAGENVAYGQRTPEEVMQAWMNSSGHRANILNSSYKEIGIGVYYKNGTYYWSQLFIG